MPLDFQVRSYLPDDFAAVCELDAICFPSSVAFAPEEIHYFLSRRGARSLVATAPTQEIVAWALGEKVRRTGAGHIITIDVHPEFRRLKIGTALMNVLEDDFRRHGCACVRLEVAAEDLGAQAFYTGREYQARRTLRRYYADGRDAVRMERQL